MIESCGHYSGKHRTYSRWCIQLSVQIMLKRMLTFKCESSASLVDMCSTHCRSKVWQAGLTNYADSSCSLSIMGNTDFVFSVQPPRPAQHQAWQGMIDSTYGCGSWNCLVHNKAVTVLHAFCRYPNRLIKGKGIEQDKKKKSVAALASNGRWWSCMNGLTILISAAKLYKIPKINDFTEYLLYTSVK